MMQDVVVRRDRLSDEQFHQIRDQYEQEGLYFEEDEQGMHFYLSEHQLGELADRVDAVGGTTTAFRQRNGL